jgi:Lon protease-like protein
LLFETSVRDNGLVVGEVALKQPPEPDPMREEWQSLLDVMFSLETHPHVQRLNLPVDHGDAWSIAYTLLQLLPLEEHVKYELLGLDDIEELMGELDVILNQISG